MATVNEVAVKITVQGKQLEHVLDGLNARMNELDKSGQKTGGGLGSVFSKGNMIFMAVSAAIGGVGLAMNALAQKASDMAEEVSKMNVVFAGAGDKAFELRDKLHDAYSMSYLESTRLMARTGDLMVSFGANSDQAADMAFQINSLAADLVSFKNIEGGVEAASDAMTKALMGERESAKMLGIVIKESDVQARLAAEGKDSLTGAAKNLAVAETTLKLIYESQKSALGDLERTQFSYANQQRQAKAALDDIGLAIGATLLPLWNKLMIAINKFIREIGPEKIAGSLNAAYEVIKSFVEQAIQMFNVLWTAIKVMAIATDEMIKGNFAGAGALMEANFNYLATESVKSWENIKEAAEKGYADGMEMFKDFLRGQDQERKDADDKNKERSYKTYEEFLATLGDEDKKAVQDWMKEQEAANEWKAEQDNLAMEQELELEERKKQIGFDGYIARQALRIQEEAEKMAAAEREKARVIEGASVAWNEASSYFAMMGQQNEKSFKIWKALSIAEATISTFAGVARAFKDYMFPFSLIIAASVMAKGMNQVNQIKKMKFQKFALGGLVDRPTAGIVGEAGAEVIAPKKTFIDVTNELINKGTIGSDNTMVVRKLDMLNKSISNMRLEANLDAEKLAIVAEIGDKIKAKKEY